VSDQSIAVISALGEDIRNAANQFVSIGIGLIEMAIIFVCASIVARVIRRPIRGRLSATLFPENAKRIVENAISFGVYVAAATLLLTFWGVTWTTLLTAIGISTLFVAFGLQGLLQSLVAGILILFERPYNVGDKITYAGEHVEGTVEEIALRTTVVRADDGTRVVAPNSFFLNKAIANHSPDRAVVTIVTVHGAGSPGRTPDASRALAETTLSGVDGFATCPDISIRTRLENRHVPRMIARVPRLGPWSERVLEHARNQGTQIRISWSGFSDPAAQEKVVNLLAVAFPESRVSVRRW
jgi:mechanosensitive ion channel-like protein